MIKAVEKIAQQEGTPFYIYDEAMMISRVQEMFGFFQGIRAYPTFAVKANANPHLLGVFVREGLGMDVISVGEWMAARRAGADPKNIVWNGNVKQVDEMHFMVKEGLGWANVDSFRELENWNRIKGLDTTALPGLFIRINPSVGADTHPSIATGKGEHKFGISCKELPDVMAYAAQFHLPVVGMHVHIGSQITAIEPLREAIHIVSQEAKTYGLTRINIGGGWGIAYAEGSSLDLKAFRKQAFPLLSSFKVWCELGRFLLGEAGWYIVRVGEVRNRDEGVLVITDGGMHHLLRPSLYQARHTFSLAGSGSEERGKVKIMGRLCETGDVLVPETEGVIPKEGDLLAIHQAGAYGFSMASHYNAFPLPSEWLVKKDGKVMCIRHRESPDAFLHAVPLPEELEC